jgi:hypothetical protein
MEEEHNIILHGIGLEAVEPRERLFIEHLQSIVADPDSFRKQFVLKPSVTIAISGELSAPARKLFGVLYSHAFDFIQEKTHTIALPALDAALDGTIPSYDWLQRHLLELVETSVQWNILGKDKRIWGAAALLASVEVDEEKSLVTYAIAEKLQNPASVMPYAKLDIRLQNRLQSANSLTLYELLTDYYSEKFGKGETGWIELQLFQRLLGTDYREWRDIQRRLIQEPLQRLKDLDFTIAYETKRRGRKVTAVKFTMKRKEKEARQLPPPPKKPRTIQEAVEKLTQKQIHDINMEAIRRLDAGPKEEDVKMKFFEIVKERYL